ncbi:MAG TPA: hypothetical protein VKP30_22375 [Polyangiaceae bacterium]|nr:hypothetical protein [Polyangiaceae bacterium]
MHGQRTVALGLGLLALKLMCGCTTTGVIVELPNSSGGSAASAGTRSTTTLRTGGNSAGTGETSTKAGSTSGSARGGSSGEGGSTLFATTTGRPSHCSNQTQDADESGVDCGGSGCAWCAEEYALNPPDQCENQFYYENCTPGDANSACGGVCQPRNACENAASKDGTVGFACSRYMMFSPQMIQASEDDATAQGWSTSDGSLFLYAVARHDANLGGVDSGMVGQLPCCECYQLVFASPSLNGENTSAPWPIPRPLVVQVFNVGGSSDSFDLYVGAGGFGGLNGCTDGTIRSSAGFALYDAYPSLGQPNDGGVKFSNPLLTECRSAGDKALTPSSVASEDCQSKIAEYCSEISTSKSASLASTTRNSCIYGNQLNTLYHQSWTVWAKRVQCPENLTRVTGCRLAPESGLAMPDAKVSSAEQAKTAGFSSGYRTSTMQDCCKPACSWTDKVGGREGSKNADATFSSFYACNASDNPMVESR